jgi:hypothetical protein
MTTSDGVVFDLQESTLRRQLRAEKGETAIELCVCLCWRAGMYACGQPWLPFFKCWPLCFLRQGFSLAWKPSDSPVSASLVIGLVLYTTTVNYFMWVWDRIKDPMFSGKALCPLCLFPSSVWQPWWTRPETSYNPSSTFHCLEHSLLTPTLQASARGVVQHHPAV